MPQRLSMMIHCSYADFKEGQAFASLSLAESGPEPISYVLEYCVHLVLQGQVISPILYENVSQCEEMFATIRRCPLREGSGV